MSGDAAFTDPDSVLSMEAEHLPLWRAYLRTFSHLLVPGVRVMDFGCNRGGLLTLLCRETAQGSPAACPGIGVGIDLDTPGVRTILAQAARAVRAMGATRESRDRYPLLFTTSPPVSFPSQFDLVVSHEVVYLLPDVGETFAGIHTALDSGGHFSFTTGCHEENPLFPTWTASFEALGITAHEHSEAYYESALRDCGFIDVQRDRLRLAPEEYDAWVRSRESVAPNPAWFPDAAAEKEYYTRIGKMRIVARKE